MEKDNFMGYKFVEITQGSKPGKALRKCSALRKAGFLIAITK